MDDGLLRGVPNFFYDLIVFITPTLIFIVGMFVGLGGQFTHPGKAFDGISASALVWLVILGLLVSYEYGRIAEAWSAYLVQKPMQFMRTWLPIFRHPDFLHDRNGLYTMLSLPPTVDGRDSDKWVLYFYAFYAQPLIGSDLLKRYAWEKLARSSAATYAALLIVSLFAVLSRIWSDFAWTHGPWSYGGWRLTALLAGATMITYIDYYRRNSWNYDLLTRTLPVLQEARRQTDLGQRAEVYLNVKSVP